MPSIGNHPQFLLVPERISRCLVTGRRLSWRPAGLTVVGEDRVDITLNVGSPPAKNATCYAVTRDFVGALYHHAIDPTHVKCLVSRGRRLDAGFVYDEQFFPLEEVLQSFATALDDLESPMPEPEEVRKYPIDLQAWEMDWTEALWYTEEDDNLPAFLVIVMPESGEVIRTLRTVPSPLSPEDLCDLVLQAAAGIEGIRRARPRVLRVPEGDPLDALGEMLGNYGIKVEVGPCPVAAATLQDALLEGQMDYRKPLFAEESRDAIDRFRESALQLYEARPWRQIEPDEYVAVRVGKGPWRYLALMGHEDEANAGFSTFDDFLQLSRFITETTLLEDMTGTTTVTGRIGGLESLGRYAPWALPPFEARLFAGELDILTDEIPMPLRMGEPDGVSAPSNPLAFYVAVIRALLEVLPKRGRRLAPVDRDVDVAGTTVSLRYPATGEEQVPRNARDVRVEIGAATRKGADRTTDLSVVVEGPATTPLEEIALSIQETENVEVDGIELHGHMLWAPGMTYPATLRAWHLRSMRGLRLVTDVGTSEIRFKSLRNTGRIGVSVIAPSSTITS